MALAVAQYVAPVAAYLVRRGFRPDVADEVRQVLSEKMFSGPNPRIRSYAGSGDLANWMRLSAHRLALDHLRVARAELTTRDGLAGELAAGITNKQDPEMMMLRSDCAAILRNALEAAIGDLKPRQKTILRLYYVNGLSIDRLATIFRVHRTTAARQIATIREQILQQISHALREAPGLSASDQQSMDALGRSQISFELETLLRSVPS